MRKGLPWGVVLASLFCIFTLRADDLVAHIRGTVTDPTGALVPGAQIYNLPVSLQLGQTTETVQVEADQVQVDTTVTQMGAVMTGQTIVDLPLLNRDWLTLNQLIPGAVGASDRFGNSQTTSSVTFSTNGAESQQNSFLICAGQLEGQAEPDAELRTRLADGHAA